MVLASMDDLPAALASSGVEASSAAAAVASARAAMTGTGDLRATVRVSTGSGATSLLRLELLHPDGAGIVVTPAEGGGFTATTTAANLVSRTIVRTGRMDADSFYSSAVAAGITDSLIPDFAKALAFDFDFQREVKVGDAFEAVFTQNFNAHGDPVGAPTLLFASLTTQTKSASVYHFSGAPGAGEWFDSSGHSNVRALMRTPVDGARVSSTFGMRVHPIEGYQKMHEGIDFACPIGTPIFASGNAVVTWSGMKGPNGNLVVLHHDDGRDTYYLHQSRIMPEVVVGARVSQGQKIGEVGTTGHSTGPHLHYGMKVNGAWVDPSTVAVDEGKTLSASDLAAFGKVRDQIDVSRSKPQS
jgi:murein DD-endopeptidase MepM/ murein hydrolase activator NlpD